ncbi:DeoR/GlpR family DNA-binding transcription regulator [Aureimonas jatrophae]|uniref:DNA-binding transcriptional regulator of sugar metabolism, DeoR/GlpR family n=1 Tax=Aureimonas jatrophae TaxID=1166073 RepID=A0A1H0HLE1_9HYPH|nr:DeoR/GlpR family DNA-binding transcription regulator [Aureimonas jatrophae]MBB3950649.1 DeoR/GlpR family transcriptional regulator of sugar metabolism [Aureimonas jatrophae]SDO19920.1 DNA-binding transcriptional regulator of sugar metabolism, DeoR/GlpR family [Aureimonas jatrophae]
MDAPLLTGQRQTLIREWLARDGRVLAVRLADAFGVSEDTIRRDLRELAARGECRRVYGGALPFAPQVGTLSERRDQMVARKTRLAERIVTGVMPGSTLFIDAGSTNLLVAERLPPGSGLTVVTNAPAIACALQDKPGVATVLLGGRLHGESGACLGSQTLREAERLRPTVLVLGACGLDAEAGITAHHPEEAELKGSLAERAGEVWVAATTDKFTTAASFTVAPARRLARLVVEHDCDAALVEPFAALGIACERAEAPSAVEGPRLRRAASRAA